jgi:hypothetical protein
MRDNKTCKIRDLEGRRTERDDAGDPLSIARSRRPLVIAARRKCERTRRRTMAAVGEGEVCIQKWGVMLSRLPFGV